MGLSKLEIMELFLVEGFDHARSLAECLNRMEGHPTDEILEEIHVHAHTIKGAAAMVGFMNTSHVARFIDRVVLEIIEKKLPFDDEAHGFLQEAIPIVNRFIRNITLGELNEAIILKDIASKYDRIISKAETSHA
ncbi:MAG: Hpt domain-containing protein [Bacteroidetes bacterium]|nr:Hpt domain-containing protein [Bacteroidota bacterium]